MVVLCALGMELASTFARTETSKTHPESTVSNLSRSKSLVPMSTSTLLPTRRVYLLIVNLEDPKSRSEKTNHRNLRAFSSLEEDPVLLTPSKLYERKVSREQSKSSRRNLTSRSTEQRSRKPSFQTLRKSPFVLPISTRNLRSNSFST